MNVVAGRQVDTRRGGDPPFTVRLWQNWRRTARRGKVLGALIVCNLKFPSPTKRSIQRPAVRHRAATYLLALLPDAIPIFVGKTSITDQIATK